MQLLFGAGEAELSKLHLKREVDAYFYVSQGKAARVDSISDRSDYKATMSAFRTLDFNTAEVDTIWKVVAAILLLVRLPAQGCGAPVRDWWVLTCAFLRGDRAM